MSQKTKTILRIFMGSPSDLDDERRIAREIVERVNRVHREGPWMVELLGWEDRSPGFGRPQEQINDDVRRCDLFVGLLWRRWGQPSGKYSSGFEEEFEIASARAQGHGQPAAPKIWMYFRQVDSDLTSDPGEHLKRVLDFKERIRQQNTLLYYEYLEPRDWEKKFHDDLLTFLHTKTLSATEAVDQLLNQPTPRFFDSSDGERTTPPELAPLGKAMERVLAAATSSKLHERAVDLGTARRVRLKILADAWLYFLDNQSPVLDIHGSNFIYANRDELSLTTPEAVLVLRTLVEDGNVLVPGWYFLRGLEFETLVREMKHLALNERQATVRAHAILFLADLPQRLPEILERLEPKDSDDVLLAQIQYLSRHSSPADLDLLESLLEHPTSQVAHDANLLSLRLKLAGASASQCGEEILRYAGPVSDKIAEFLDEAISRLESMQKSSLFGHKHYRIRASALKALSRADEVEHEDVFALLEDSSPQVRAQVFLYLFRLGVPVKESYIRAKLDEVSPKSRSLFDVSVDSVDAHDIVEKSMMQWPQEKLRAYADSSSIEGRAAYEELLRRFLDDCRGEIVADVADGFEKWRRKQDDLSPDRTSFLAALQSSNLNFDVSQRLRAAIRALGASLCDEERAIIRTHAASPDSDVAATAIAVLGKDGDPSDLALLIQLCRSSDKKVSSAASRASLELSNDFEGTFLEIIGGASADAVETALEALARSQASIPNRRIAPLLKSEHAAIRLKATSILLEALPPGAGQQLLSEYTAEGRYYYDVVALVDRYLYAPGDWQKRRSGWRLTGR
jgi:hypothetical protein